MNDLNESSGIGMGEVAMAHAVARKYVRDPDEAADVAQDALLRAHRHRESFRGASSYRTWLYRIVATTALSYLRSQRRRPTDRLDDDEMPVLPDEHPSAEARLAAHEGAAFVRRALEQMGPRYEPVFRLRFEDDLGEAEIAQRLGITVANVKIRTHRARRHLQANVAPLLAA